MKKDIEWLREEVYALYPNSYSAYALNDMVLKTEMVDKIIELINQLDEPEVTEEQVWEKIAEYYPGSPIGMKNSFEHFYYGGHLEKEPQKPVIPQFVADYIEKWKHEGLTIYEWLSFGNNDVDEDIYKWLYYSLNEKNRRREYLLIDAIRNGYEVEKEKLYIIKFAPSIYGTPTYGSIGMQNGKKIMQSVYGSQEGIIPNQYTRREIEEVGSEYMFFAEEVKE